MLPLYFARDIREIFQNNIMEIDPSLEITSVSIDTREMEKGAMFIAFSGAQHDGNNFINQAIDLGASCIISTRHDEEHINFMKSSGISYIIVEDAKEALYNIARYRRNQISAKVIAITGSMGKTSTKECAVAVLQRFIRVEYSLANMNTDLSISVALANVTNKAQIVVLECGMDRPGDLKLLSSIIKPDIVIITHIACSHIEFFRDQEHIVEGKAEICHSMTTDGIVILNSDNQFYDSTLREVKKHGIKNILSIGGKDASITMSGHTIDTIYSARFKIHIRTKTSSQIMSCTINDINYGMAFNTLFIIALVKLFQFDIDTAIDALSKIKAVEGRGNIEFITVDKKKIIIMNSTFNANPVSVADAISTIKKIKSVVKPKRTVCILGDMIELGDNSKKYHIDLAEHLSDGSIDIVYTVGKEMHALHTNIDDNIKGKHFQNTPALVNAIRNHLKDGDLILLKGSSTMKLSNALNALYKH